MDKIITIKIKSLISKYEIEFVVNKDELYSKLRDNLSFKIGEWYISSVNNPEIDTYEKKIFLPGRNKKRDSEKVYVYNNYYCIKELFDTFLKINCAIIENVGRSK